MKIIYLHQYFSTPAMHGGTRSYELARRLVDMGHEVHMVTSETEPTQGAKGWRETNESGIHVHWLPVPYSNSMKYADRMRAFSHFAINSAQRAMRLAGDVVFATSTPLTIAVPIALYGMCTTSMPALILKSSIDSCGEVPTPADA